MRKTLETESQFKSERKRYQNQEYEKHENET